MHTAATAAPTDVGRYEEIAIQRLVASKTNPRTHFDDAYIAELAGSIREKGLIQPLIVREHPSHRATTPPAAVTYEIVAGECRYRASKQAGLPRVPVIVREMTDAQVLEAQLEENIHRKDLTPLEEAAGYRRLIDSNPDKHSAETIATRIGMSVGYVWDRLKLNDLIPEAKKLLEAERFTVGHAILLSRLKPEDQERAIDPDGASLFNRSRGLWATDSAAEEATDRKAALAKYAEVKPVSVREFEQWIRDHIRFDVAHAAKAQPLEFEHVAREVEDASARPGRGKKVVAITYDYRVSDDARTDERTYGKEAWKRADGKEKSKTCDHSVLGVVVAGDHQGSTLQVCVARDRCLVHYADIVKAKKKAAAQREAGQTKKAAHTEKKAEESYNQKWQREQAERRAKEEAWRKLEPAIVADALDQVKGKPLTPAAVKVIGDVDLWNVTATLNKHLGKDWYKKPDARTWWVVVLADTNHDSFDDYIRDIAKPAGLNVKRLEAIRDKHAATQPAAAPTTRAATARAKARKKA